MMFVAGTAIGAAAALMMAPASGRESREYLRKQSRRVADDVSAQADRLASAVKRSRDQATTAVRETMDSVVAQAKAAYNAAKSHRTSDDIAGDDVHRQHCAPGSHTARGVVALVTWRTTARAHDGSYNSVGVSCCGSLRRRLVRPAITSLSPMMKPST